MNFFHLIIKKLFTEKIIIEHRLFIMLLLLPLMIKLALKITKPCLNDFNHDKKNNKDVPFWPTTEGIILESEVLEGITGGEDCQILNAIHLVYKYNINNKDYISSTFRMVEPPGDPESYCSEIINKYPVNCNVKVFYNPVNHEECCLQQSSKKEIARGGYAILFIGILYFLGFPLLTYSFTKIWFLTLMAVASWIFAFIYSDEKLRKKIFKNKPNTTDS